MQEEKENVVEEILNEENKTAEEQPKENVTKVSAPVSSSNQDDNVIKVDMSNKTEPEVEEVGQDAEEQPTEVLQEIVEEIDQQVEELEEVEPAPTLDVGVSEKGNVEIKIP